MQQAQRHYTVAEYFAVEAMSPVRNEYFDGEIKIADLYARVVFA